MSESQRRALQEMYGQIVRTAGELRTQVDGQLENFSTDEFPKNGTRLECLAENLGGLAAMASLALEQVNDESTFAGR